jgi:hypothetical protein
MDDYTARVLDVIKGKCGLKNRSEALHKLALEAGNEYIEPVPNEMVLKELDEMYDQATMRGEEADALIDLITDIWQLQPEEKPTHKTWDGHLT